MLGDVQAFPFLLFFDAQAQGPVDSLEDDETDDGIINNGDTNTRRLNEQLSGIPFQHTRCTADGLHREDARQQRTDNAADSMDAEGIQRVVLAHPILEIDRRPEADDPGCYANPQGAHGADEA